MNALIWNVRPINTQTVNTQKVFTRLINLKMIFKFYFIRLKEPFQTRQELERYRRRLGLKHAFINMNCKI